MRTLLLSVCVVLISACLEASPTPGGKLPVVPVFQQPYGDGDDTRIISGKEAARGQFPYQAALLIDKAAFCGGSLVTKSWVLTAGHCVKGFKTWQVTLGAHNIQDPSESGHFVGITDKAFPHEKYSVFTLDNDIALVQLPTGVELNDRINTIKLPPASFQNTDFVGKTVRVSGWGKTKDTSTGVSPTLQYVDLQIISQKQCAEYFGSIITNTKYCTSGQEGRSTCNGDSGGALTTGAGKDVTHLGIVSFGSAAGCSKGFPAGFTATPFFVDWIAKKTGTQEEDSNES